MPVKPPTRSLPLATFPSRGEVNEGLLSSPSPLRGEGREGVSRIASRGHAGA